MNLRSRIYNTPLLLLSAIFALTACNRFVDGELAESVDDDLVSDIAPDDSDGVEDPPTDEGVEADPSDADERSSEDVIEDVPTDQDPCSACGERQCGEFGECPSCGDCTGCKSLCVGNACVAVELDHQSCSGGHPYWYDSCAVKGSLVETCDGEEACAEAGALAFCIIVPEGFAYIPPGTFCMGSPGGGGSAECPDGTAESARITSEGPLHEVTLTRGFFLQETEVTQRQWLAQFPDWNPSYHPECGLDCPAEGVNWWEAVAYVNALSLSEGLEPCYTLQGCDAQPGTRIDCTGSTVSDPDASGNPYLCEGYRLPMEAEWEYAYRAGTRTAFQNGGITATGCVSDPNLDAIGWYCGNSEVTYDNCFDSSRWGGPVCSGTQEVGERLANDWGLHDMSGNVWEWVWDQYQSDYYSSSPLEDPLGGTGSLSVVRGGSFGGSAQDCRAANRVGEGTGRRTNIIGFRPARSDLSSHP